jgi:hypothetical protein
VLSISAPELSGEQLNQPTFTITIPFIQLTNIKQKWQALMSIQKDELVIINYVENIA